MSHASATTRCAGNRTRLCDPCCGARWHVASSEIHTHLVGRSCLYCRRPCHDWRWMDYPMRTRSTGEHAWETCTMTTDQSSPDDVARLRDCLNDLASTLALPAQWTSGELPHIVSSLLDALVGRTSELIAANERLNTEVAELRRTEQILRANELNFQLTVDSMPGMVHTMTATGGVEFVNHQVLDFFGKTIEELSRWDMLLHPDDRPRVVDLWTQSVATGEPFDVEVRALRADGTYRWLHSRGLPLRDTNGNIVRWHNLLTDIDERKRAEEALRESERESRLIVDSIDRKSVV